MAKIIIKHCNKINNLDALRIATTIVTDMQSVGIVYSIREGSDLGDNYITAHTELTKAGALKITMYRCFQE